MSQVAFSVVAPFYNEAEGLRAFVDSLRISCDDLGMPYEVILVDDGSTDGSIDVLQGIVWPECTIVRLIANSGHQNALDAGLHETSGNWVITMDADGQHPPSLIPDLIDTISNSDVDVVYAVPRTRKADSWFKRRTASAYYSLMRFGSGVQIRKNAADFRIMSRRAVEAINQIDEEKVFRLLIPSFGFPSAEIAYDVRERVFGKSKYTIRKMISLGARSVISFSPLPLRWVSGLGFVTALLAFIFVIFVVASYLIGSVVPGWASVMIVVLFLGGIQLLSIGLIGEYIINVQTRVRNRPNFIVARKEKLESPLNEPSNLMHHDF